MLSLCVYNRNDQSVPTLTRSSNFASSCVSKTYEDKQIIFKINFQCTYLAKQRNFAMEFLDSGANCISLVRKSAHFVVLKKHINHTIYTHDVSRPTVVWGRKYIWYILTHGTHHAHPFRIFKQRYRLTVLLTTGP
jgi:hypothetical protein